MMTLFADCASHQTADGSDGQRDSESTSSSYDERLCCEDLESPTADGDLVKDKTTEDYPESSGMDNEVAGDADNSVETSSHVRGSVCSHQSDEMYQGSRPGRSASNVSNVSEELSLKVADLCVDQHSRRLDKS